MRRRSDLARALLLLHPALAACGKDEPPPPRVEAQPSKADTTIPDAKAEAAPTGREAPKDLARATAAAPVGAKGEDHLGFKLDELAKQYALAGVVRTPSWGDAGTGGLELVRDDDIDTTWMCNADGTRICAIGLAFTEPVELTAVRLFATAGPKWNTHRAHARPKRVRLHTDTGWVEAKLEDGAAHRYVVLGQPVTTRTLAVEVTELYPGTKDKQIHVGELEAFGRQGPRREPLEIDPERAYVSFESEPWKGEGTSNTIRQVFIGTIDETGTPHRLVRGTAMFGRSDDRFVVIERMFSDACTTSKGGYLLLDRETRVMAPLVDKLPLPARVSLHPSGTGALLQHDGPEASARAIVWQEDKLAQHRPREKKGESIAAFATRLGFAEPPVARGGHRPGSAAAGCVAGTSAVPFVERVAQAANVPELSPSDVSICPLSATHRVAIGVAGSCGRRVVVAVIGGADEIVGTHVGKPEDSRGAWYLPMEGLGVLVESSTKLGARAVLLRAEADGITVLADGGGLAVRRPIGCEACEGDYGIAAGITAEVGESDGATDEGAPADASVDAGAPADHDGGDEGEPAAPEKDDDGEVPEKDDGAPPPPDDPAPNLPSVED